MNIILLSNLRKGPVNVSVRRRTIVAGLVGLFVFMPAFFVVLGYGFAGYIKGPLKTQLLESTELASQRDKVEQLALEARNGIHALTLRVGEIQARAIRLDALGSRLVEMAKLDEGEFDFDNLPAVGGPEELGVLDEMDIPDFLYALDQLSRKLEDREQQLSVLESMLLNESLRDEVVPAGRPIESGWLSSPFGKRTDPFTGKRAFHEGVDFAGKKGSNVISVASGVVTWSGDRYGYGRMVEVDHGNGYVTRYGHNKENLVKVGDIIKKGQVVALMGSSGRSTGPHVHFEVLRNGRPVNPAKYVRAAR